MLIVSPKAMSLEGKKLESEKEIAWYEYRDHPHQSSCFETPPGYVLHNCS